MLVRSLSAAAWLLAASSAFAQPTPDGFLCCNPRTDGGWIADINDAESGKRLIPVGTPAKVTGYGRYRVHVLLDGRDKQSIANDYSRDLAMGDFMACYAVAEVPKTKLASDPPKVREAIASARVSKGMTREQALMAVGYLVSSENPRLDAKVWRYWLSSFAEFQVVFDKGRVREITTGPQTANIVVMD